AAGIAEHLERAVAEHVPAEAQAWRPLRLGLPHVGAGAGIGVDEAVVAQAEGKQQAIVDLPLVLDVLGLLAGEQVAALGEDVLGGVVAARPVRVTGRSTHAEGGGYG